MEAIMKPGDRMEREDICRYIPHRGRNLVMDGIDFFEEGGPLMGRSTLTSGVGWSPSALGGPMPTW